MHTSSQRQNIDSFGSPALNGQGQLVMQKKKFIADDYIV